MPYLNDFHNAVTYELSPTNQIFYRTVYNFFDWLTDIGGLYGAIFAICYGFVKVCQFQGHYMFLMTEMFATT